MLPKHHKTGFFLKSGLFDNLTNFAELEDRISRLPTSVDVGDAFEVFAEAYFFTQKIEQAEEVWPFKSVPSSIKEGLSLGTNQKDMGVDGVYKTTSGQFNAYQAKFRTGRPSLTWREISTFMGLTDNVNQRVLFTNSNDITSVINERSGFHCIRGNDLDRLNKSGFETILKWLQRGNVEAERKSPLPHQAEAIKDILSTLKNEDRATALMACGTGKTLVALWVTEQMKCQNVLVLLPSLTLVRQTLHEWLKETVLSHLSYLCVCSDPTVAGKELDSIKINQSDLDFAVTTDTTTVKQFLSQDAKGVKIVFSTYQSSNIVAEAMSKNDSFDLGIFDEAHKTAGREGKKFGFALKDDNLGIKKRMFLTATPRHYNLNKRNKEGDLDLVYSMDNPAVYGEVAHELSFAKAARQDIICNYKVIISVVTSEQDEMLADIIRQMQEDKGKGGKGGVIVGPIDVIGVDISLKALQESITAVCIDKLGFTWDLRYGELIKYKEQFGDCNVPQGWTENKPLANWVATQRSNYRNEKLSKGQIRRLEDIGFVWKRISYIPSKASREEMFDALNEYKNDHGDCNVPQDWTENKPLAKWVNSQHISYKKGKLTDDHIKCLEDIGFEWRRKNFKWDEMLYELMKYKNKHGHCNIPNGWSDVRLVDWVHTQRKEYINGKLSKDRIERLNDIGFVWKRNEAQWDEMLHELMKYKNKHGHCNVHRGEYSENKKLGDWVHIQRKHYRNGKLIYDRIKCLEDMGFEWEESSLEEILLGEEWNKKYDELKKYKKNHGDCNVPRNWSNKQLVQWICNQRDNYKNGELSSNCIKNLEDIGFKWMSYLTNYDEIWDEKCDMLTEYKRKHGHCNIPNGWADKQLVIWVNGQRTKYRNKELSENQIKRLDEIGFIWDINKLKWEKMFEALEVYRKERGDCNVPFPYRKNMQLANWVNGQHTKYRNKELSDYRIKRLEGIGFEWKYDKPLLKTKKGDKQWESMFEYLKEHKNLHGDCNDSSSMYLSLRGWANKQRANYKNKYLSDEHIKRLEDIGFVWSIHKR